jgi:hypothetical protein
MEIRQDSEALQYLFFYWVLSKIQNVDSTGPKLGLEAPKIIKQMKFHLT